METMTTVAFSTQAYDGPVSLFRVVGGAVLCSYRPVSRPECLGFGGAVSQVEYVSGAELPGAAQALGLRGHAAGRGAEGASDVPHVDAEQRTPLLAQVDGAEADQDGAGDGISGFNSTISDNGSDNGTNGSKPMTPWGYRTSSPPG